MLPADLRSAELEALAACAEALAADPRGLWTLELRFEGLRLLPVVLRLARALLSGSADLRLLYSDMGATALARRDAPDLAERIASLADERRLQQQGSPSSGPLLMVGVGAADADLVEAVCGDHRNGVILINASLEDAAVGIGSVARSRRRGFISRWQAAYALVPGAVSALRRAYPGPWELYRLDPDGYRPVTTFDHRPDGEQQAEALAG
jgi:hypothetical protein